MGLDWLATISAEAAGFLAEVNRLFARLVGFPVATVAAVNGHSFGAGTVLAVAHGVVVMRQDRGYWSLPEADLGFPVTPAMFAVIAAKLPGRTAQEAVLTDRRYGGPDAVAAGIVHQVASEEVLARVPSWPQAWLARSAGRWRSTSACRMARRSRSARDEQARRGHADAAGALVSRAVASPQGSSRPQHALRRSLSVRCWPGRRRRQGQASRGPAPRRSIRRSGAPGR